MRTLAVLALASCGRIGFGATDDAGGGGSGIVDALAIDAPPIQDLACNTPVVLGPVTPITGRLWVAAAESLDGLAIVYAADEVRAVEVNLRGAIPTVSPDVLLGAVSLANLQVTWLDDRLLVGGNEGAGTTLLMRDPHLGEIATRNYPNFFVTSSQHSMRAKPGRAVLAGLGTGTFRLVDVDETGNIATPTDLVIANVGSPGISPLFDGTYAAVWTTNGTTSNLGFFDANLVMSTPITVPYTPCRYPRVAPTNDNDHVAITCICTSGCTPSTVYSRVATTFTPQVNLSNTAVAPTRSIATSAGFWTAYPSSPGTGAVRFGDLAGQLTPVKTLGTIPAIADGFGYEVVVRDDDRAYAVWIDSVTAPVLRMMQLCP